MELVATGSFGTGLPSTKKHSSLQLLNPPFFRRMEKKTPGTLKEFNSNVRAEME